MLILGAGSPCVLVFLPGFFLPARAYRQLLLPVAAEGLECRVPQLYPRGPAALAGRHRVQDEARAAAALVARLGESGRPVWLGGHSRGGQAAWRAAALCPVAGLVLVDPVAGTGPRSSPTATVRQPGFEVTPCVIGAGVAGRCAPAGLDHNAFSRAAPHAAHVVVTDCGHGDMLGGAWQRAAHALCGGGADPDGARRVVSHLINSWLADQGGFLHRLPPGACAAGSE